jgi:transcriptional regulator with GAF, ATPase, and Fis domain
VTRLIGPLIEHIVLLHRERKRRRRLEALASLARVFGVGLIAKVIFARLVEAVRPVVDFDFMGTGLFSPVGQDLELLVTADDDPSHAEPGPRPLDHFSSAAKIEAGETVLHRDVRVELDRVRPGGRMIIESGGCSNLCVPIWFDEQVRGFLGFGKRKPNWYDQLDVEIATGIAAQVALAVEHQRLAEERARKLERRLAALRDEMGERYGFGRILGRSRALRDALARAEKVAPTETTVMIAGESGTGKELVARAIHQSSLGAEGRFVAINCAALSETLVKSELFGHERGAFIGADKQKPGRSELARRGRSSWMRWPSYPRRSRPSSSGSSRSTSSSGSEAPRRSRRMSGSSRPPTGIWPGPWRRGSFARISTTA